MSRHTPPPRRLPHRTLPPHPAVPALNVPRAAFVGLPRAYWDPPVGSDFALLSPGWARGRRPLSYPGGGHLRTFRLSSHAPSVAGRGARALCYSHFTAPAQRALLWSASAWLRAWAPVGPCPSRIRAPSRPPPAPGGNIPNPALSTDPASPVRPPRPLSRGLHPAPLSWQRPLPLGCRASPARPLSSPRQGLAAGGHAGDPPEAGSARGSSSVFCPPPGLPVTPSSRPSWLV